MGGKGHFIFSLGLVPVRPRKKEPPTPCRSRLLACSFGRVITRRETFGRSRVMHETRIVIGPEALASMETTERDRYGWKMSTYAARSFKELSGHEERERWNVTRSIRCQSVAVRNRNREIPVLMSRRSDSRSMEITNWTGNGRTNLIARHGIPSTLENPWEFFTGC